MKNYLRLYGSLLAAVLIGLAVQAPQTAYAQCTQFISDPNFEAGNPWSSWPIKTSQKFPGPTGPMCDAGCGPTKPPRDGANWAWFGGFTSADPEVATLGRNITIPTGSHSTLVFYLQRATVTSPFNDTFIVQISGTTVSTITEPSSADGSYIRYVVDVSSFANGASRPLLFTYTRPGGTLGNNSDFLLDGVFLGNCPTASASGISGRIVGADGLPVAGAVVRVNGAASRMVMTDANGNYNVDELETGGFYTVTPSLPNYHFSPAERSFSMFGNQTNAEFTASADAGATANAIDSDEYFVRQQYLDFLGREPDEAGLNFWVNSIQSCGNDANCRASKRVDTSAAFFLSTEFEQTGYLVYRTFQAAYGDQPGAPVPVSLGEFAPDTARVGNGVIVNKLGWEGVLESNKRAYMEEFVQRARFNAAYPSTMTPIAFVDQLFSTAGVEPSVSERAAAIDEFGAAGNSADIAARGRALRRVAENSKLENQESNQAFVLMQYLGYLKRDANSGPDSDFSGYYFWLNKLNSFDGDFRAAEMVKSFLLSGEYRGRFRQ